MLIHHVCFWLRTDLSAEDRATFDHEVRRLAQLPYLERGYVGTPAGTEARPVTDHSFDYATSLHFRTHEDHVYYQTECQDHARFVSRCHALWDRVLIHDIAPLI
jgi:hypothetical protein